MTEAGRACCLFIIDDDMMETPIDGKTPREWLKVFFPAVPKVVLTRPGHAEVTLPARRWTKKEARVLECPARYHERIVHLFKSFWLPRPRPSSPVPAASASGR